MSHGEEVTLILLVTIGVLAIIMAYGMFLMTYDDFDDDEDDALPSAEDD